MSNISEEPNFGTNPNISDNISFDILLSISRNHNNISIPNYYKVNINDLSLSLSTTD